jgi:hypothetical protein
MTYQKILSFVDKNIIYLIILSYLFCMLFFYLAPDFMISNKSMELGYLTGGDTKRYLIGSEKILNLELPSRKSYIGYILYIAIFQYLKLNLSYVVISQIFLSVLASLCIYKITKKLSNRFGGIFCLFLFLFYLPLQIWNFYILTETLFICSIIYILFFIIFFQKKYIPLIIILFIFTISIRPHGIILIPSFFLASLIWAYIGNNFKIFWSIILFICILTYPTILILNVYLADNNLENLMPNAPIIWGYKEMFNSTGFIISDSSNGDIYSLLIFVKNNINIFISSFFKKVWFFLVRVRPYYSDFHNFYLIFFNIIYYPLAIYGFLKLKSKSLLGTILMYSIIVFFTFTAGLTFADWDSRFSLYITPIFFIFASIGLVEIINLRKDKKNS